MTQHAQAQAATALHQQDAPATTVGIREQLDATTRTVTLAHEAYVRESLESVEWERRGPLRRLVRRERFDEAAEDRVVELRGQ